MPQGGEPGSRFVKLRRHVQQMLAENSRVLASVRRILFGGGLENRASVGRQQIGRQSSWEPELLGSPPAKQVDPNERGVPATQAGALLEPKGFRLESRIG